MRVWPGRPYPLGANWDGAGVNFALFSEHGTKVELCLFDSPDATKECQRIVMPERTDQVWHCYLPDALPGQLYGYRVHGPYEPDKGHRFNANKVVLDPYAKLIGRDVHWDDSLFGYTIGQDDLSFNERDNALFAPLGAVVDTAFTWGDDRPPRTPWHKTLIYEAHVKGLTRRHPGVPEPLRGTYAGLACEPILKHLQELRVTAIELLPVHHFLQDRHLVERGLANYWGYNTLSYFAPELAYDATSNSLSAVHELLLAPALETARAERGAEDPDVAELMSIVTAVRHLPSRDEADPARVAEGRAEAGVIRRRLAELTERSPEVAAHVRRALERLACPRTDPAALADLDRLLEAQAYRPCFWRVALDEINYRRFFDINDLAALSSEREDVFAAIHKKLFEWLAAGWADGLRIDHPDGLYDPRQYLDRLQTAFRLACAHRLLEARPADYPGLSWEEGQRPLAERLAAAPGHPLYVVVEKILGPLEPLPPDWATDGTTGYEFAIAVNGLFVDPAREAEMTAVYRAFTGEDDPFDEVVYRKKYLVLQSSLSSELQMLAHQLDHIAQAEPFSRDFTLHGLRRALREVIACFPVYRSFVNGRVRDSDRAVILRAVRRARQRNPLLGREVFDFIRDTLLLKDPPRGPASEEYRVAQVRFAGKFQQVTAPVMAKGLEDTALYVFNRLTSLNEVGGDPGRFGGSPAQVHAFLAERAARQPAGLNPLSTHDTKRGEDVRARISVLAEMPHEWGRRLQRWAGLNHAHKIEVEEGLVAPDANEEYLLYQTLLGAWPLEPLDGATRAAFIERIQAYMNKAIHEAKVHTSWINPDQAYDQAVGEFVARILDPERSPEFLADLQEFQRVVSGFGMVNSLAQTLIRCTAPGVPDTYQGTELWDYSLVDPDNRRPVDYTVRVKMLRELDERAAGDRRELVRELVRLRTDGRIKLFAVSRALRFRRERAQLFAEGAYEPVEAAGERAGHVFAYLRTAGGQAVLTAVPRLVSGLVESPEQAPVGAQVWRDTRLTLPATWAGRTWRNVLTGEEVQADGETMPVARLLADVPVGLFEAVPS